MFRKHAPWTAGVMHRHCVLMQHYMMLQRNPLYTGVTRGRKLVVLVGQKKAIAMAVKNASSRRRWSKLAEWLDQSPATHVMK